jgi:putative heme-binding domain-containing protein
MTRLVLGRRVLACGAIWLVGLAGGVGAQDHADYEAADIEYGLTLYLSQCATCHGEGGAEIAGVDFRSGQIRRAGSDRELRALISNGIPGTGMLAFDLDPSEMTGIIAYLRNMNYEADAVTIGDAARGRVVFEGIGDCYRCHRVKDRGPRIAPELTNIGRTRPPSALRRSLIDPTGTMQPINRPVELLTADGTRVTGRRLNEDTYTVQLIDDQERLRSFDKAELREFNVLTESTMPSYQDELSAEELADLLAYLVSLKG